MKKITLLLIFFCCFLSKAQYTREQIKAIWEPRVMPSRINIDSTWNAVLFKGEAGGGSVTSVTAGSGLLSSPNPIVGAGTLKADTSILATKRFVDSVASASNAWLVTGNSGLNSSTNFLGTLDNVPLIFRIDNTLSGKISNTNENTYFGYGTDIGSLHPSNTHNTAIGHTALGSNYQGNYNTAIGQAALTNNYSGTSNTALGVNALSANTSGSYNIGVGIASLSNDTSGLYNIAVGVNALIADKRGEGNLGLGSFSNVGFDSLTNATAIGYNAVVNTSNSIVLGEAANVGIGTSSPTNVLHIIGSPRIVDGGQGLNKVLTSDATGVATWQTPVTGVTSVGTSSPITGGTITSTGTIACPTCVTSTTPGLGIAHFAGSTQNVTSSLIVNADISNASINLTTKVTGVLPETNGGTNQSTFSTGNILYASAANTLSKLSIGSSGQVLTVAGGIPSWVSPTTGTVTSVAETFTGGLISVAGSPVTSSGTFALTVAGTSGGIAYFSASNAWASSSLLSSNALMIGGGAGVAPSTVTTGTGVLTALGVNTGSVGAFVVNGGVLGTPSSGTLTSNIIGTTQSQNDNSTKLSTTAYTDLAVSNGIAGVNPAVSVQAATTANVSGYTYNNGASGVGATLTQNSAAVVVIDGYTLLLNDRVLFKDQTTGANNGIYVVTTLGTGIIPAVFMRATDYNQPSDINNTGAIPVINGTANATTSWVQIANIVAVGTTSLIFTEFSLAPSTLVTLTGTQALTNKTYNGNTWTAGTGVLTLAASKTLTASNSITLAGTDGTTISAAGNVTHSGAFTQTYIATGNTSVTVPTSGTLATVSQIKSFTYGSGQAYAVVATGTDEVAYSVAIPAGTILTDAIIEIRGLLTTTASANTKNFKIWLSTASETVGAAPSGSATQIGLYNANGGTSTTVGLYRMFIVRSLTSVVAGRAATSSLSNDIGNSTNVNTTITIPTLANATWLVFSVERANGADTFQIEGCYGLVRNL